eukprot:485000-Rhodomonas_salina.4
MDMVARPVRSPTYTFVSEPHEHGRYESEDDLGRAEGDDVKRRRTKETRSTSRMLMTPRHLVLLPVRES